jgi:dimethylargininase
MTVALTRRVGASFAECVLTYVDRAPIDLERAMVQHEEYERALESLGAQVQSLASADQLPDSVFVEDCAVVLDEVAVLTPMGTPSRVPETELLLPVLEAMRPVRRVEAPAKLEGGDVLCVDRTLFVGLSTRTDVGGGAALAAIAEEHGYQVCHVPVVGCLHLKTAVGHLGDRTLLMNPAWVDARLFAGYRLLPVDATEPWAANVLRVENTILASSAYPRTIRRLEIEGFPVCVVDIAEFHKAEAGLTCMSLILQSTG